MEPWSYASDGRDLLFSDEVGLHLDAFTRSKKPLMEWDNKPTYNFESGALVSDSEVAESVEFVELGISDLVRKTCRGNQGAEKLNSEVGSGSSKRAASPSRMVTSNSCFEEVASEPKLSSFAMEATMKDSLLIDLKLGIFADCKDEEDSKLLIYRPDLLCTRPSLLTKKARKTSSYSQPAFCQVHGCKKDLSSSKDYHKRHKVCDVHSKTTKVIVNGIEQRFCQQCSRFHLLAEFDDGKRSCRKRLAGHNERRRKPQQDTLSGSRYQGTSLPKRTPFVLPNIHHSGVVCPGTYERANGFTHIKLEGESFYSPQSAIPTRTGQLLQKSFFHLHGIGKQHSFGVSASGSEDCNINIPTIQELSGASISSRALSLLSTQSQELSSHLIGTPMASPEIIHGGSSHHGAGQISDRPLRVSSVEQYGPNGVYSYWRNAAEVDKMVSTMVSNGSHAADFEAHTNVIFQETDILKPKYCPPENGPTVDWLQLSSHLQRVELQKHSFQVKWEIEENEESHYFPTFRSVCNQQG